MKNSSVTERQITSFVDGYGYVLTLNHHSSGSSIEICAGKKKSFSGSYCLSIQDAELLIAELVNGVEQLKALRDRGYEWDGRWYRPPNEDSSG